MILQSGAVMECPVNRKDEKDTTLKEKNTNFNVAKAMCFERKKKQIRAKGVR